MQRLGNKNPYANMSNKVTVLYFKNTPILPKILRKIKFGWGTLLNFKSQAFMLQIGAVCYAGGESKLTYGMEAGCLGWGGQGYPLFHLSDAQTPVLPGLLYQFGDGGVTSSNEGKARWIQRPNNFKQRLFFFFGNTIHITVKCLILAGLQVERLKLRGWVRKGTEQGVDTECFSSTPCEQEQAI